MIQKTHDHGFKQKQIVPSTLQFACTFEKQYNGDLLQIIM